MLSSNQYPSSSGTQKALTGGERHLGHRSYAKKERPTPQSCGKSAAGNALRYPADAAGLPGGGLAGFSAGSRGSLGEELRKDRLDVREETQGVSLPCRQIFSTRWGVHRIGTPSVYGLCRRSLRLR